MPRPRPLPIDLPGALAQVVALALALAVLWPAAAAGHALPISSVDLDYRPGAIEGRAIVHMRDLAPGLGIASTDAAANPTSFVARATRIEQLLGARLVAKVRTRGGTSARGWPSPSASSTAGSGWMKRIAVLTAITLGGMAAVLATSDVTAQGGLPGINEIEQISGNVYKIFGAGGNTTVFVRENDVVLVDTKLPGSGTSILAEVRKITDKPIGLVINTHSHPDHTGSNAELAGDDRVQVVAQTNSAARMRAGGGPFPALEVDQAFDDRLTLGEGADRVELYYFGPGHTDGDAFVVFPADRTMAAGDIYAWHMSPLIDPTSGGSMIALPTTLTEAEYTIKDVDTVITGHGAAYSWDEFRSYVKFNRALVQVAEATLADGGDEQAALAELGREPSHMVFLGEELMEGLEYGGTASSRALINLMVAFQELRGEEPQLIMGLPPRGAPAAPADEN